MRQPLKRYLRRRACKRVRQVHPDDEWGAATDDNDHGDDFWAIATGCDHLEASK